MGWYIIIAPSKVKKEKETAIGQMCIDIFENDCTKFEIYTHSYELTHSSGAYSK